MICLDLDNSLDEFDFKREGIACVTAALGYPNENKDFRVKSLEIVI